MSALRDALVGYAERVPVGDVAVFLSGGYDSWALVFALRAARARRVVGYTFHVAGIESTDLKLARAGAKTFGLELIEVPLWGTQPSKLVDDIRWMKATLGVRQKAEIECVWPFFKAIKNVAEEHVFLGHEDLYGMTKRAAIHFREKMDAYREEAQAHAANQNAALGQLFSRNGKQMHMPFESDAVRRVFVGKNWDDMHKPGTKQMTVDAFPEDFAKIKVIRQGLQVGDSGIRDAFAKLLESPFNVTKARDVTAIYNRI